MGKKILSIPVKMSHSCFRLSYLIRGIFLSFFFFFLLFFFCACATVEDTTRSRSQVLSLGVSVEAYLGAWRDLSCHRLTKSACKNYHRAALLSDRMHSRMHSFSSRRTNEIRAVLPLLLPLIDREMD